MRWTERQRAMLREMGVRLWERDSATELAGGDVLIDEAPAEAAAAVAAPPPAAAPWPAATPSSTRVASDWPPADWLVVGDALEATAGEDPARLLGHMLRAARLSQDATTRAGRACHFALSAATRQQLDAVLERVRPRMILALGRAAAEVLLDVDEPLGRLRGQVHRRAGVRVVVSFPLAYLLRNPSEKAKAWADLCLAVGSLESDADAAAPLA